MGNEQSNSQRTALSAMADMMRITKKQLIELRSVCLSVAKRKRKNVYVISRADFQSAMKDVELDYKDYEILDHLFTMWDKTGEGYVNILLFLSGISPLASIMDITTKLRISFEMYDFRNTGILIEDEMIKILGGINATASYFGDAVITNQQIEEVVEEIFSIEGYKDIKYVDHLEDIASHPSIIQFATGKGTIRYGSGKHM